MNGPLLSVLIPTLAWREAKFLALLGGLLAQAGACPAPVEVVALHNAGQESLARYRQRLLDSAAGAYLCFVDDDDLVSPDYLDRIAGALTAGPDVVGFLAECSGLDAPLTVLSLANGTCGNSDGPQETSRGLAYLRSANHLSPVRASLARQAGFLGAGEVYSGEDSAYAGKLLPLLTARGSREVFVDTVLYHYRFSWADTTQASRPAYAGSHARYAALRAQYAGHQPPAVAHPCFRWCP